MKFLHIADLHLGKRVCEYSMLEEQQAILTAIAQQAVAEGVGAVLIAGDVYDRPVPPAEAIALFSDFLERLHRAGIATLMIAGNHDSAERLCFAAPMLAKQGVHVAGACRGVPEAVIFEEGELRVAVHLLSHFRPAALLPYFNGTRFENSEQALRAILSGMDLSIADRHVLLAHLFVSGSVTSDSELPVIGTVDAVPRELFSNFDYVALGHLHRPQSFGSVVYAGSPLCYSFSEAGQQKSAVLVEVTSNGVTTRRLPLAPIHAMREVKGSMEELMSAPYSEDYIRAVVTDEEVAPDARMTLRTVYPNLMRFAIENSHTVAQEEISLGEGVEGRDPFALFAEFFEAQNGTPPTERQISLMRDILKEAEVEQ
ncbi:MAG: exonuclease SbcCD subunit D [Clostridia bacterium]|nr:exonuclease SbcCD subunit D [Clostridia bacterium]